MGTVKTATAGALGFDVNQNLSAAQAAGFKSAGYDFCIRYLPRTAPLTKGNLTSTEIKNILEAGLALMAVQHCPEPGWSPSAALGMQYGQYAAEYAVEIGLPPGMSVWLDLEGVIPLLAQGVRDYCYAWYNAVGSQAAGYVPGLYVGFGTGLTPQELYEDLPFRHYWKAYNGPSLPVRGYQIIQETVKLMEGISFDPNRLVADNLGGLPLWLSPD